MSSIIPGPNATLNDLKNALASHNKKFNGFLQHVEEKRADADITIMEAMIKTKRIMNTLQERIDNCV